MQFTRLLATALTLIASTSAAALAQADATQTDGGAASPQEVRLYPAQSLLPGPV